MDSLIRTLDEVREQLLAIKQWAQRAQALAPRSEGWDEAGAVSMVLAPDGLPESVRVEPDWAQDLEPGQLGSAVLDAYGDAQADRTQQWYAALEREHLAGDEPLSVRPEPESGEAPAWSSARPQRERRSAEAAAKEAIAAFDAVEARLREPIPPPAGNGFAADERVRVTMTPGRLVDCAIDGRWAQRQSAAALTMAVGHAMAAARVDLDRAVSVNTAKRLRRDTRGSR